MNGLVGSVLSKVQVTTEKFEHLFNSNNINGYFNSGNSI